MTKPAVKPRLKSYVAVDLSHNGRVSSWERHTPMGNFHLYVRRDVSGTTVAGLLSFRDQRDRERMKMLILSKWETNNFHFTSSSAEGLKKYRAFEQEKENKKAPLRDRLANLEKALKF